MEDDPIAAAVLAAVRDVLVDLDRSPEDVSGADHLEADLSLDSLAVVEVVARVEQATGRRVPDALLADIRTVDDMVVVVSGGRVDRAGFVAPAEPGNARPADSTRNGATVADLVGGLYALAVFGGIASLAWAIVAVLPGIDRRWAVVRAAGRAMLALTRTRLRVVGADRLPAGPYVAVANHASFLDPLVLAMVLPPPVVFTAVEGLAANPVVRHFLRRMDCYPVVPGDRQRGRAAVADLTAVVRRGRVLAAFPEGRRSPRTGVEPFRLGAFRVAGDAQVPVVPIAIRGTRTILPVKAALPRRSSVLVNVGEPIASTATGWSSAVELRARARREILAQLDEPDLA